MCINTIFSKYLVLPMTTFPYGLSRLRSDIYFRDKKIVYLLTINPRQSLEIKPKNCYLYYICFIIKTKFFFILNKIWLTEFESVHIVWKTIGLPLTYNH